MRDTSERPFCGYASKDAGIAWFRVFGRGLKLYAPWKRPLFSERYGHQKMLKVGGWRAGYLSRTEGLGA